MDTRRVGIIVAPGVLDNVVDRLKKRVADRLEEEVSDSVEWEIEFITDSLTGFAETKEELYDKTVDYLEDNEWSHVVTVTDLPVHNDDKIIAIEINKSKKAALISIPAYGWPPIKKKVSRSIVSIIKIMEDLYDQEKQKRHFKKFFPTSRLHHQRETMEETGEERIVYYLNNNIRGILRLTGGMAWANNPFNMMRSLSGVIAIAFATGSFGLIFSTMWNLSYYFPNWRLGGITLMAVIGMVVWIIVSHNLWERNAPEKHKRIVKLYNRTTLVTLFISLFFYYVVLYIMFLSAGLMLLPSNYVASSIGVEEIGIGFYLQLAWFAASISTVAGAIGAGIQDEGLIRESTYGNRQRSRYQKTLESE